MTEELKTSENDSRIAGFRDAIASLLGVEPSRMRATYCDEVCSDGLCEWNFFIDDQPISAEQEQQIVASLRGPGLRLPSGQVARWHSFVDAESQE